MTPTPSIGQLVHVRKRTFVVADVVRSAFPPPALPQHLVRLSSLEEDDLGQEVEVIWELEPGAAAFENSNLPEPKSIDHPKRLSAFLDAVRWGAVSQADDKSLQSPFRSGIEIDEYQLDPVVRALTMPRVNLLIADDVGLGKTIEAGLVAQELMLRHRVRTILIACPSSLQIQWQEEMRDKFGLEFRIVDSEAVSRLRRKRGIHVNPWSHFPRLITSIDFLKRERPLAKFRETLPSGDQPTYPRPYDLLIVDEAHNVAPSGRTKYATDSMRTSAIRTIARHFEHKLFLSATPHNGFRESFAALLELLDNQRFARAAMPSRNQLDAVMVRRMKSELIFRSDGTRRFADRIVKHLEVPYTDAEKNAHRLLQQYSKLRQEKSASPGERQAIEFVLKLLKKRMFSSPAAFAVTLAKHIESSKSTSRISEESVWQKDLDRYEDDFSDDEEYEEVAQGAIDTATRVASTLTAEERSILKDLEAYATHSASLPDSKAKVLISWLESHLKTGGNWNDERVIIFTEYRATQKWLHNLLATAGFAKDGRLLMLFGGMPSDKRDEIKAAFQADPTKSNVRILLATDSASEGVNLQNHCSKLIHFEIPWNPNRMEQRNGRVDRHGQRAQEVHVHHFVGKGFDAARVKTRVGDLESDLEFLMRAALKVETIREDLGKVGPVITDQVSLAMLGKISVLNTTKAEQESEPVRKLLKFERKIRDQLEKLAAQLHETQSDLNLTPDHIENVVNVGLELAGQPALIPGKINDINVFYVPQLTGSWAQCAVGLPHPHTQVVRPIVFDPSLINGSDEIVLCHLNHQLVQMCLRLLRAEIWSQESHRRLSRVTACLVDDAVLAEPTLLAHGRIVVLGGDNHRLHEEVITAGGVIRTGRFNRLNVGETTAALKSTTSEIAAPDLMPIIKTTWQTHQVSLMKSLEARMEERTKNLEKFLTERSNREIANLEVILSELKKTIESEIGREDEIIQPNLPGFDFVEKDQRQRDLDSLRHRLSEIPDELKNETLHLRRRYENPKARLFPVAVTFLIPKSMAKSADERSK
jgi:superfamily II DNA or RNA helicase